MELMGPISEGLKALKKPCEVTLYTDSKYVVDGINQGWAAGWRANNWRKADKNKQRILIVGRTIRFTR